TRHRPRRRERHHRAARRARDPQRPRERHQRRCHRRILLAQEPARQRDPAPRRALAHHGSESPAWSGVALACGLLSKENAAVAPALVALAWSLGVTRPPRRTMVALAAAWAVAG